MNASLRDYPDARSVLQRMAEDADRARRIRKLKGLRPELTWTVVAEYVGVTERSVLSWAAKGEIGYPNCMKLAEFFGVDGDWLYRGKKTTTGSATLEDVDSQRLDAIEASVANLDRKFDALISLLGSDRTALQREQAARAIAQALVEAARIRDEQDRSGESTAADA